MRPRTLLLAAGLGLAVCVGGGGAFAQPSPDTRAAAAALFEDGRRLMGEGKFAEACPKLEESQRMDPGMGTLYNLANCYEQTNRTASAWVGYRDVASAASNAGQADREKLARGKAAALEPRLMRLKITVQPDIATSGAEVKRDGAVVSPALWGTPVPLDPGKHKVSASAPGKEPWEVTVVLDQPGAVVAVEVPPLLPKKAGAPVVGPVPPPHTGPETPPGPPPVEPPPPDAVSPRPWQRPLGIAATAVGAVGLGVGVAFGFLAKSKFNESTAGTPPDCDANNKCNDHGLTIRSDALQKGNIGTGVFIGGAVLAAGGIILWITAPSAPAAPAPAKAAVWQRPSIGLGPNGVALRAAW